MASVTERFRLGCSATAQSDAKPRGFLIDQDFRTLFPPVRVEPENVADGGKAEQRMVSIGATYGDRIVITKGVTAGDAVIVGNLQKIAPGAPVRPIAGPRQASTRTSGGAASG